MRGTFLVLSPNGQTVHKFKSQTKRRFVAVRIDGNDLTIVGRTDHWWEEEYRAGATAVVNTETGRVWYLRFPESWEAPPSDPTRKGDGLDSLRSLLP